ncbi:MAG: hypothetical protein JWN08_386 [Frankiales bacterium]|nr:hypothetical protein [Frankiales bacterium]
MTVRRRLLLPLLALVAGAAAAGVTAAPASAACASNTGKSISGTVFGQDGRDVNVSIGFDLVDAGGRALNADPRSASYGCAKTGGYSVPQSYLNHFVGPEGAPQASVMNDGARTTRAWKVGSIPSNAVGAYVEVYHRGYQGSPCKDANGNWCFNPQTLTKYGNSNKHLVPVGTANLPIRLPMTCGHKGTAGAIKGVVTNSAGQRVALKSLYAWTEAKWNAYPFYQGWGTARFSSTGVYAVPSLASRQRYVMWATTTGGKVLKRTGVLVDDCATTTVNWRV